MEKLAIVAGLSYLLGSIPFGYLLVRIFHNEDVRRTGSGNIGATNVARRSVALGIATLVLDAGKGFAAGVVLVQLTYWREIIDWAYLNVPWSQDPWPHPFPSEIYVAAAAASLFAVVGHIFPIWLKFRGGKGVATAAGSFAVLAPDAMLAAFGAFLLMVMLFRYVSLGSMVGVAVFPVAAYLLHRQALPASAYALMGVGSALIVGRHHANIRRLLAGTENRLHFLRHKESA
ncbi:MAG TPA: glycerol-3-phosphate 1-O-acyltransferase PlsY [Terriglobales bacterium]|nr:glycerol-3-phosphate 1-O-acyltransferase PlsY [Terriglobales bacterium]